MVAAMRSDRGASRKVLQACLSRKARMLLSVPLIIEYEAVLTRAEHLEAARVSRDEMAVLLDHFVAAAVPVELVFQWRPNLPDPDDDMVLETAVNGRADALVTFNRRDFLPAANLFGVNILHPGDVVQWLEM